MWRRWSVHVDPGSVAMLWRLAFRLLVIVAFALLWPSQSVAVATAALCTVLAMGCFAAAHVFGEPFGAATMNHWDEGAILLAVALLVLLKFA
jgi:hypothetical protein